MLKSFRELKISLAAKCQLLFGVAVALIIAAALFMPWQRMEELMDELDRRSARVLADAVVVEHMTSPPPMPDRPTTSRPARTGEAGATTRGVRMGQSSHFVPRLTGAWREDLTLTERRALVQFARENGDDERSIRYTRRDGTAAYRYTRALYASAECLACHSERFTPPLTVTPADDRGQPTGDPVPLPPRLLGTVTVDLVSQKEQSQVMLNRVFFLAAGLLAGSLAIVTFSLITNRFILQPVRVLQETAEKVSDGDLEVRSHIGTGDEFTQLSDTLNTMLTNLQKSEGQLRAMNRSLDVKLAQLSEVNVALAETNRLKSEFLANVSHELRTPLNSILGFAELLRKGAEGAGDARNTRWAQNIYTSGTNLLALINDLLDLAKVEAGKMEVRPSEFTLSELFESLSSVLKPLTEPKGLTIACEVESRVPILTQDVSKVQQILYNFLSNAIKFSPQGGTIALRAAADDVEEDATEDGGVLAVVERVKSVRITVTDEGPGIEPEKQKLIFEKFRQLDGAVTRQHGGTGLGLAISKELTALLGGSIGVESSVGEGATFYVVLPVRYES